MGLETALVLTGLGAAASAGGAAYQAVEAHSARQDAKRQAEQQAAEQNRLLEEEKKRQAEQESADAERVATQQARQRQRALAGGAQGRAGTILTSPLGVMGEAQTAGKTLLGA